VLCDLANAAGDMVPPAIRAFGAWLQNRTHMAGSLPLINTVITNVPGIPGMNTRYFAGAAIRDVFPLVPVCDGMAISHGITGIYDRLNLGVVADRKVVPDMDFYIACMEASTQEYLDCVAVLEAAQANAAPQALVAPDESPTKTPGKPQGKKNTKPRTSKTATKSVRNSSSLPKADAGPSTPL
jgi:hypothetical protein